MASPSLIASRAPIMNKCGALTRAGGICAQRGSGAGGRCRFHGGLSPGGKVTHGRAARFAETFGHIWDRARHDPELLRFETDIAIYSMRQEELAERIGAGDTPEYRK